MRKQGCMAAVVGGLLLAGPVMAESQSDRSASTAGVCTPVRVADSDAAAYVWSLDQEKLQHDMEVFAEETGMRVLRTEKNQLKLEIPSTISFDSGRYDIKSEFVPILNRLAQSLRGSSSTVVRIVGHTDSTGSDAINHPLSLNRALGAREYLMQRGVGGSSIAAAGMGSYHPIATNATVEGRARNRRVEIFIEEHLQSRAPIFFCDER